MDYQAFVDTCSAACAVLSVEKKPGGYGDIRILCANESYKKVMGSGYYDNMLYDELVPKDLKFEDFCFRAALQNQVMHAYVETRALDCWTDQKLIPLNSDRDDMGYCQFVFEFTPEAEPSRMAKISNDAAKAVIEASTTMLGASDLKEGLIAVQRTILRISEGFSSRIMLVDDEEESATVFCEKFAEGVVVETLSGDASIPYELAKSWERTMGDSNSIIVKNEHDMCELEKRNPEWVQSLRQYRVMSIVLIPLRREDAIIGWLYVTNYNVEKTVLVKELLEIMTFVLGAEIASHQLVDKLETLSNMDPLTGIQNRRAMITLMDELAENDSGQAFGVVFLDMNGLKAINDRYGHQAGDKLLIDATKELQKVFKKEELYRTGGDEFIVISTNTTQEEFENRVEQIRKNMQGASHVSFAVGPCWRDETLSASDAFRKADTRMYADKRAFYSENPDARVRE